jgi:hypothetical protein
MFLVFEEGREDDVFEFVEDLLDDLDGLFQVDESRVQVDLLFLFGLAGHSMLSCVFWQNGVPPAGHKGLFAIIFDTLPGFRLPANEHDTGQIILSIVKGRLFEIADYQNDIIHVGFDVFDDEFHFFLFLLLQDLVVNLVVFLVQFEVDSLLESQDVILFEQVGKEVEDVVELVLVQG